MADGCQVHAGILDPQGKLTPRAKQLFIQDCKELLQHGTANLPTPPLFTCCKPINAVPHAELLDLENEKKFPEFHKNILGSFEKIANSLNTPSNFTLLPICDPIALGFKLGVNIKIKKFPEGFIPFLVPNLPLLALKMKKIPPVELALKFPGLINLPPPLPSFDIPPHIKLPDFNTFFDFSLAYSVGIPKLLANIILKVPELALKLPNLPQLMKSICDVACDAKLFGDVKPGSTTEAAAVSVLNRKTVEMVFIAAAGSTLGSAPGGITGGLGKTFKYYPPEDQQEDPAQNVRDQIVKYANDCIGLSWGDKSTRDEYTSRLLYVEYNEPDGSDPRYTGKAKTELLIQPLSTCGMLARACLFAANASYVMDYQSDKPTSRVQNPNAELYYDFYKDRYRNGTAIAGLRQSAKAKNAIIQGYGETTVDLPSLKKGDIVILSDPQDFSPGASGVGKRDHVLVLLEDYTPGSFKLTTAEGGQADVLNPNPNPTGGFFPSSIKKRIYLNRQATDVEKSAEPDPTTYQTIFIDKGGTKRVHLNDRVVSMIIDGEKICTDPTGSSMLSPDITLQGTRSSDDYEAPDQSQVSK